MLHIRKMFFINVACLLYIKFLLYILFGVDISITPNTHIFNILTLHVVNIT